MAKPIEWLEEFQANTGDAATGGQDNPMIVGLSNGNILVAWEERASGLIGTSTGDDIVGKIYDAKGDVVRDAFQINAFAAVDDERDFDVAATNDGGFMLAYVDDDISSVNQTSIIWERFNANGNYQFGNRIADENVAADFLANPQIAVNLKDNSSYVTFTDDVGANTDIRGVRLDAQGNIVTPEFNAAQNSVDIDTNGDAAILRNGNLVSVYEEEDPADFTIEGRITGPDGIQRHSFQVSNFSGTDRDPQVASLRNGGFVVTWERAQDIQYQVFDKQGVSVSGIRNAVASSNNENEPDVTALPDGSFVIVWDDDTNGRTRGRRYNPDGSPEGGRFTISDDAGTDQDVGVAADGRILTAWLEELGEIHGSIWDPRESPVEVDDYGKKLRNFVATENATAAAEGGRLKGTNKDNILIGSNEEDKIDGYRGNDIILGRDDDDNLRGGRGHDELAGGEGENILNGGKGRDIASYFDAEKRVIASLDSPNKNKGQAADDKYKSIEGLRGSDYNDRLTGDSGKNALHGGDGKDWLKGLEGDDELYGGARKDKLEGGRDDDILEGGDKRDQFIFEKGDGDDIITDFEVGIDKIVIGKGASNLGDLDISQFGSDTLIEFANVTILLENVSPSDLDSGDFIL